MLQSTYKIDFMARPYFFIKKNCLDNIECCMKSILFMLVEVVASFQGKNLTQEKVNNLNVVGFKLLMINLITCEIIDQHWAWDPKNILALGEHATVWNGIKAKQHNENNFNKQHQKCAQRLNAIMLMFEELEDSNFVSLSFAIWRRWLHCDYFPKTKSQLPILELCKACSTTP